MSWGGKRPGAGRKRKEYRYPGDEEEKPLTTTENGGFSQEEIAKLRKSQHIRKVTDKTVSYTVGFKELFWKRYNEGATPPQIFAEAGLDVDVLGDTRVYGLLTMLRRVKQRGAAFTDGREPCQPPQRDKQPDVPVQKPPRMPPNRKLVVGNIDEQEVRRLLHQVAYLTQEMEFIKKIISLGNGGASK
jgi:hypothetical protein